MKNVFVISLHTLVLVGLVPALAQEMNPNDSQENLYKLGGLDAANGVVRQFDNRYDGTKGSPFYIDQWSVGQVTMESGKQIKNLKLKYNAFEDEVIVNGGNRNPAYLNKEVTKSFSIFDENLKDSLHFVRLPHPKKADKNQFYRMLEDGEIQLLEFTKIVFEKADFEGGYSNNKTFDEFKRYPSYFVKNKDNKKPTKLKSTASAISKIFPSHSSEIKKYIFDNSLDCRQADALIKVFRYYKTLDKKTLRP